MKRQSAVSIIAHFENACRADEMRGCAHPDDRDYIHECYKTARERMIKHLMKEKKP